MDNLHNGKRPLPIPACLLRRIAVALALAVIAPTAMADVVSLFTEDVCDDPSTSFDRAWAATAMNAHKSYILIRGRGIFPINTTDPFDANANTELFVATHGNGGMVGNVTSTEFADAGHGAHGTPFTTMRFAVCHSAEGGGGRPSAARAMADVYGNRVNAIFASNGPCALTGNGSADLAPATYRTLPARPHVQLFNAVSTQIQHDWMQSGLGRQCRQILDDAAATHDYRTLDHFMRAAYERYSTAPVVVRHEDQSMNYLLRVKENTGGSAQRQCGPANGQACP